MYTIYLNWFISISNSDNIPLQKKIPKYMKFVLFMHIDVMCINLRSLSSTSTLIPFDSPSEIVTVRTPHNQVIGPWVEATLQGSVYQFYNT